MKRNIAASGGTSKAPKEPGRAGSAVPLQISFVVPLYNHLAQTQAMLASLLATMPKGVTYEIILIDDFSTDGTRAWLATLADPNIKTLLNPHNLGFARTSNRAAQVASGEVLALLNNDLLLSPGWLAPMLQTLLSPKLKAGLVGNVQYRVADGKLDHAGVQLTPGAQLVHIQTLADDAPAHTRAWAVTGACMLMRKADFDAMGGFDEQFVNGCEDIDLCFRLRAAGKAIYVANTSRIRHHVSLSRKVNTLRNERNSRYLFSRWRTLIKQELAAQWAGLLQAGPHAYAGLISGHLAPAFTAPPPAAAQVIAEAMLLRQEYRWARILGDADPRPAAAGQCTASGLVYRHGLNGYALTQGASFAFSGLRSVRNFYVCGYATVDFARQPVAITISVNGIQAQTTTLTTGRSINVGIIDPILLQGAPNHFQVTAHFVGRRGQLLGDANAALVVTHIVIDDQGVSTIKLTQTMEQTAMPPNLDLQDLILALRPDLCERFGFDTPQGRPGFLVWLMTSGLLEYKALFDDPAFRARVQDSARGKGALTGLQRLLWQARPDVQQAFALPRQSADYLHWFYRHGVGEHGVWHFLDPAEKARALQQEGPWQASFKQRALDDALRPPAIPWRQRPWGVNVVGYAFGQLGIGEDARMAATALRAAGVPMCMLNFEPGPDVAQNDTSMQAHVTADGPYAVNLFCLTALEHGRFYAERGLQQLQGRYNIGY
ncbi:MAG: glycosyltransferase family 2 protein [Ramlibacter sp.]